MCLHPRALTSGIVVPCGSCIECCNKYSTEWSVRIMDEAKQHKESCFLTLTYAETNGELCKADFQKFIKRLRAYLAPVEVRYFLCGEYGGKGNRPHAHCIIFGWKPPDLVKLYKSGDNMLYRSAIVERLWQTNSKTAFEAGNVPGFCSVGDLTQKSAKYCAKYMQKLDKRPHKVKPFLLMSRRPGIGACAVDTKYLAFTERFIDGKSYPVPRYYVQRLENLGYNTDMVKSRRTYIKKQMQAGDPFSIENINAARLRAQAVENNFENSKKRY